ncbi:protein PAM68 chloroplastic-like [Trifolium pratense]|uniref:Protein PAM68 chloroplastic-like n=1 Tax=Trifolium pratense TaxID=57577 RepID=A0A2K3L5N7_TRIPR|nr:protein PAM68 chloroplastic-like [Trifolium pratense]
MTTTSTPPTLLNPQFLHKGPKGFGSSPKKNNKTKNLKKNKSFKSLKKNKKQENDDEEEEEDEVEQEDRREQGIIPEIVTNRMIGRMAFSVGIPLGVSYGIVSASWDPLREGSFLGWTEAQKNWPVFWQSLRSDSGKD